MDGLKVNCLPTYLVPTTMGEKGHARVPSLHRIQEQLPCLRSRVQPKHRLVSRHALPKILLLFHQAQLPKQIKRRESSAAPLQDLLHQSPERHRIGESGKVHEGDADPGPVHDGAGIQTAGHLAELKGVQVPLPATGYKPAEADACPV